MKQLFENQSFAGLVEYDSGKTGADFIVMPTQVKKEAIPIEVGWNKTTSKQVAVTAKRIKSSRYNLVITDCELSLDRSNATVFVPLQTFLLMQPDSFNHPGSAESIDL